MTNIFTKHCTGISAGFQSSCGLKIRPQIKITYIQTGRFTFTGALKIDLSACIKKSSKTKQQLTAQEIHNIITLSVLRFLVSTIVTD